MPTLLAEGNVKPNKYRIIEGKTLLERAQGAIDALRRREASGERREYSLGFPPFSIWMYSRDVPADLIINADCKPVVVWRVAE
jgi:hypothetical protein